MLLEAFNPIIVNLWLQTFGTKISIRKTLTSKKYSFELRSKARIMKDPGVRREILNSRLFSTDYSTVVQYLHNGGLAVPVVVVLATLCSAGEGAAGGGVSGER